MLLNRSSWRHTPFRNRNEIEIKLKSFCGLIIEQLCFSMLTHYNKNPNVVIELDSGNNSIDQIDLKIHKKWVEGVADDYKSITKTVEIRSSFPFKSIEKVVSQDFDILGGYKNDIKKALLCSNRTINRVIRHLK